jgi:hypothetical protein
MHHELQMLCGVCARRVEVRVPIVRPTRDGQIRN